MTNKHPRINDDEKKVFLSLDHLWICLVAMPLRNVPSPSRAILPLSEMLGVKVMLHPNPIHVPETCEINRRNLASKILRSFFTAGLRGRLLTTAMNAGIQITLVKPECHRHDGKRTVAVWEFAELGNWSLYPAIEKCYV